VWRRSVRVGLVGLLLAALAAGGARGLALASAGRSYQAGVPTAGALYADGQGGRYLLGGSWLFRFDDRGAGSREHFQNETSAKGWEVIGVPNAWNAGESSTASYAPNVGWYRKDFVLPSANPADTWIVRFESVNNTATIWLNGHLIGQHTGAFLAFEVPLPAGELRRHGTNRLVVRVSDASTPTSVPPSTGPGSKGTEGGWWNYGGLLREVYLREVNGIDIASALVLPHLACAACAAEVDYSVVVHNYDASAREVTLNTVYGTIDGSLGTRLIAPGASATFTTRITVSDPTLWSPSDPYLYDATLTALARAPGSHGSAVPVASYFLESGIRSVTVSAGQLYLNYQPLNFRGVGWVEDSPTVGAALSDADIAALFAQVKALGATVIRFQYPIPPYLEQLADEQGVMLWSEIPVYQANVANLAAITPTAVRDQRENIIENGSHPSIIVWSIANELSSNVGPQESTYYKTLAHTVHSYDPTRPVAVAYQGDPSASCQAGYAPIQVLGINDYFGWYSGVNGNIADPELLAPFLAKEHACYPNQALVISEFGAEGAASGPADQRGTYQYQDNWISSQLGVIDATPYLSGAIYWALEDFQVWPGWAGGNPFPSPPLFQKGLLDFNGNPKPAFGVVQSFYEATDQVGG
jgi:beta-glucuronidase